MSRLGPDGTFVEEPATGGLDGATDLSAAPLWAAFRDRYTRAKKRRQNAAPEHDWTIPAEHPVTRAGECLEISCCE